MASFQEALSRAVREMPRPPAGVAAGPPPPYDPLADAEREAQQRLASELRRRAIERADSTAEEQAELAREEAITRRAEASARRAAAMRAMDPPPPPAGPENELMRFFANQAASNQEAMQGLMNTMLLQNRKEMEEWRAKALAPPPPPADPLAAFKGTFGILDELEKLYERTRGPAAAAAPPPGLTATDAITYLEARQRIDEGQRQHELALARLDREAEGKEAEIEVERERVNALKDMAGKVGELLLPAVADRLSGNGAQNGTPPPGNPDGNLQAGTVPAPPTVAFACPACALELTAPSWDAHGNRPTMVCPNPQCNQQFLLPAEHVIIANPDGSPVAQGDAGGRLMLPPPNGNGHANGNGNGLRGFDVPL